MNATTALGYAWVEYFAMRNAIKGIIKEFGVTSLAEVKKVVDARPCVEDVRALEQRISQMTFEMNRLREQVKPKDEAIALHQMALEVAIEDVVRIGSICKVPGQVQLNANLYEVGIIRSEVFKAESPRPSTMTKITRWWTESG